MPSVGKRYRKQNVYSKAKGGLKQIKSHQTRRVNKHDIPIIWHGLKTQKVPIKLFTEECNILWAFPCNKCARYSIQIDTHQEQHENHMVKKRSAGCKVLILHQSILIIAESRVTFGECCYGWLPSTSCFFLSAFPSNTTPSKSLNWQEECNLSIQHATTPGPKTLLLVVQ